MPKIPTHQNSLAKPGRHCNKCPNRPLRTECIHTKAGLAFLSSVSTSNVPETRTPNVPETRTPNVPETCSVPVASRESDPVVPSPVASQQSAPAPDWSSDINSSTCDTSSTVMNRPAIDPFLLAQSSQASTSTADFSPRTPQTPTPAQVAAELDKGSSARIRITAANPIHGHVEGAKRGNILYDIVRTKALRTPLTDSQAAGKRFRRSMEELIVRCENLAHETGCWLYIAAQHATATSGFTHYASPRLRREAKSQLGEIQQQFNNMSAALVTSRRREAMDLAVQLQQAQEQEKQAQAEAESTRRTLLQDQATIAAKDVMIARLQAIIDST